MPFNPNTGYSVISLINPGLGFICVDIVKFGHKLHYHGRFGFVILLDASAGVP